MPEKSVKKTATKKPVAKKVVAKPVTVKKPVAKKAPVKKAPIVEPMPACGHACCECACAKKKCAFGSFLKKFIVFLIVFGMGFATAKMCCMGPRGKMAPRPEFENGCLVVKCPKMAEKVAMMDADKDGCVTRAEFREARRQMKRGPRPEMPAQPEMPEAPVAE